MMKKQPRCPRLAKSMTITNIAELKKVIFDYCIARDIPSSCIIAYIKEFEASVRERLKICDDLVERLKRDGEKWEYHPARVEAITLRRILGEEAR